MQLDIDIATHVHVKADGPKRRFFLLDLKWASENFVASHLITVVHAKFYNIIKQNCGVNFSYRLTFFIFNLYSLLCLETADRPGLLLEVIKILADINVEVESAEIDTEV